MPDALSVGDPLPWLAQRCGPDGTTFMLEAVGGRFALFCLPDEATARQPDVITRLIHDLSPSVDNVNRVLFVVVPDTHAEPYRAAWEGNPGIRILLDGDGTIRQALHPGPQRETCWLVTSPRLQVIFRRNFPSLADSLATITDMVRYLPGIAAFDPHGAAPVLSVNAILERELCEALIKAFHAAPRAMSPVMTHQDGKTAYLDNTIRKIRMDADVPPTLMLEIENRLARRLGPEIEKAFQFSVTNIDRAVIGYYGSNPRGHFSAHRDNTLPETRHRRFACSINLNDDYEGGFIAFPEFGARAFRPAAGAGIVFSCSLMHLVTPVTKRGRYALLLFLY